VEDYIGGFVFAWNVLFKAKLYLICYASVFLRAKAATAFSASAIAILSVCPSVTRVDQSKTVQARITKSSPSAA